MYITRIFKFINIRFPLYLHGLFGLVSFFAMYLLWQILTAGKINIGLAAVTGSITFVGMLLLCRIYDELKDYETDKKLFPDRPLQTGLVSVGDLKIFAVILSLIMIMLNLIYWNIITIAFFILFTFAFFMFKWFFAPSIISKSILLALVTHEPYIPLSYLYVIAIASSEQPVSFTAADTIVPILMFWLPFITWEISRKIRAPGHETDYETYSKVLGAKAAAFICLCFIIITGSLLMTIISNLSLSYIYAGICLTVFIYTAGAFIRFIIMPTDKNSKLEPFMDMLLLVMQLGMIIELFIY